MVLNLAVSSIKSRFDHEGYQTFSHIEQLLFKEKAGLPVEGISILFVTSLKTTLTRQLYFNAFGQENLV